MLAQQTPLSQTNRRKFEQLTLLLQQQYASDAKEVGPNHWVFEVRTGQKRSQVVHLAYRDRPTQEEKKPRLIASSPIGPLPRRVDHEALLRMNATLDVGAICIEDFVEAGKKRMPYLTVRASLLIEWADFDEVWEMLQKVARVADSLEKDIFVHDLH